MSFLSKINKNYKTLSIKTGGELLNVGKVVRACLKKLNDK